MSVFDNAKGGMQKPEPRSVGIIVEDRYTGPYNGKARVTKVEEVSNLGGAIFVHLTGAKIGADGKQVPIHMTDGYFPKKNQAISDEDWEATQRNKIANTLASAGELVPNAIDLKDGKKMLESVVGKVVTISQYTPAGQTQPRINYKFDEIKWQESAPATAEAQETQEFPF